MAFQLIPPPSSSIVAGTPAIASNVNDWFGQIEDELNAVSAIDTDAVGTLQIRDNAVTQAKIDLSGFTPTADEDPVTLSYFNTDLDSKASDYYGVQLNTSNDSVGVALAPDVYDESGSAGTIVQKMYKAQSDGMLIVIARTLNNSAEVSTTYYGRLMVWVHSSSVLNYGIEGTDYNIVDKSEWDISQPPLYNGQFLRYDNYYKAGPVTATVPIKKGDYFRVMSVRKNDGTNLYRSANSSTVRTNTYMRWIGFGSSLAPIRQ